MTIISQTDRRKIDRRAVTAKTKLECAVWIAAAALVSFAAGIWATSQFIGDFIEVTK